MLNLLGINSSLNVITKTIINISGVLIVKQKMLKIF